MPHAPEPPLRVAAQPRRPVARGLRALLAAVLLVTTLAVPAWLDAASSAKVVVVVGPVGRLNAYYKGEAREIIAEARRHTSNVVVLFTPNATWDRVRTASRGASVFVYFGHGWGYPSRYTPFDPTRQDGMALDPASGADGTRRVYYGESRVRASIRLAPGAAVLLYRLCYASGNTEPGLSEGTTRQSMQRVDNFGAGFLATGAKIVIADGHPSSPANYMRQLFTTDRSMLTMFRAAPNYHRHILGPYASRRTPGARYVMDPDRGGLDPKGFYRSIIGDLSLRTTQVTRRAPYPTPVPSPSPLPSPSPSVEPTPGPSVEPSPTPSIEPTPGPSVEPSPTPSIEPTPSASIDPSPTE